MTTEIIIDFDSTFVKVEALDELARIALRDDPRREEIVAQIEAITRAGMNGELGFNESLTKRLALFSVNRHHLEELIAFLKQKVTSSLKLEREFIKSHADQIYIISGGFKEYIVPVVGEFGIQAGHVLANTFIWDKQDVVSGCDLTNPLSKDGGKVIQLYDLALTGHVVMVGDGYSDLETRQAGVAHQFVAFTENQRRESVVAGADHVATSFHDVVTWCTQVQPIGLSASSVR